jgi:hypothetical protein
VRGAYSVHDLARYMIECETSILYEAQAPSWRSQRSGWLSRPGRCKSPIRLPAIWAGPGSRT